jgi:hypothetical protein
VHWIFVLDAVHVTSGTSTLQVYNLCSAHASHSAPLHGMVTLLIRCTNCCFCAERQALQCTVLEVNRQQAGSQLANLFCLSSSMQGVHWVVNMTSAAAATLHSGTTSLSVKKGRVGAIEDCYAFIPFEGAPEQSDEVCVMEVTGIASVKWQQEDEQFDPDKGCFLPRLVCFNKWGDTGFRTETQHTATHNWRA